MVNPDTNAKYIDSSADQPSRRPTTKPSATIAPDSTDRTGHTTRRPVSMPAANSRLIVLESMQRFALPNKNADIKGSTYCDCQRRQANTLPGDGPSGSDPLAASFRARDLRGKPISGAAVEYRATFGRCRLTILPFSRVVPSVSEEHVRCNGGGKIASARFVPKVISPSR